MIGKSEIRNLPFYKTSKGVLLRNLYLNLIFLETRANNISKYLKLYFLLCILKKQKSLFINLSINFVFIIIDVMSNYILSSTQNALKITSES